MKLLVLLAGLMILGSGCKSQRVKPRETCVYSGEDSILGCDDPRLGDENRNYFRNMQDKDVCSNMDDFLDTQREVLKLIKIIEENSNCKDFTKAIF